MRKIMKIAVVVSLISLMVGVAPLFAEKMEKVNNWPKSPLVFVIPFGYGGGFDTFARTLAIPMGDFSPVPLTMLNVAGAGASRAMLFTQQQPNDGYTIMGMEASQLISEEKIDFKILNDFDFVAMACTDSMQVYVAADSQFKTFKELVDWAKANPKKLKIGSNDAGGSFDLQVHYLFDLLGAEVTYVPYEHAATKGQAATLAGKLHAYWDVIGRWRAVLDGDKARALVTTAEKRIDLYPDIPTLQELGHDVNIGIYRGFGVKKGTPPERIEFIAELLKKGLESPRFQKDADKLNIKVDFRRADAFRAFIEKQKKMYSEIGDKLGYF